MSERPAPSPFRTMTEAEIREVLAVDVPARLATLDPGGYPYITPKAERSWEPKVFVPALSW